MCEIGVHAHDRYRRMDNWILLLVGGSSITAMPRSTNSQEATNFCVNNLPFLGALATPLQRSVNGCPTTSQNGAGLSKIMDLSEHLSLSYRGSEQVRNRPELSAICGAKSL